MRAMPVGPIIPEATLEWLRLHTKSRDVPLIFYERGWVDGVYTHTDRQRAYGSPEFTKALAASSNEASFWQMGHAL